MKIEFDENGKAKEEPLKSGRVLEDLLRVHIVSNDLIFVFHLEHLVFRDGNLKLKGDFTWANMVGIDSVGKLCTHGSAVAHKDSPVDNTIMIFTMDYDDRYQLETKSVYDQKRSPSN